MRASELRARDRVIVRVNGHEHAAQVLQLSRERITGGVRNWVGVELGSGRRLKVRPRQVVRIVRAAPRMDPTHAARGLERVGLDEGES